VTSRHYDLAIIGGGPAGYGAALYAANAGLRVALVEEDKLGGTCLNRGCIPAKSFLESAHVRRTATHAADFGVQTGEVVVDFSAAQARKDRIVRQLSAGLQGLLRKRKVEIVSGRGQLSAGRRITLQGGSALSADHILLAAGSVPRELPGIPADGDRVMTSDHVLSLRALPARVAIIGGGVIGLEFASMTADLGSKVVVLEAAPRTLGDLDVDIASSVLKSLARRGVAVRTGVIVQGMKRNRDGVVVLTDAGEETADAVVVSVGRVPRTTGLVTPDVDVRLDSTGHILVDALMRTHEPKVYAAGDVVATPQLAHVAFAEAIVAVRDMLGERPRPIDYANVPWCVYTHPEAAFVGLSEAAAREAGHDVIVKTETFVGNGRAMIVGDAEGLIKVVSERGRNGQSGRILGVHMSGPLVTEQIVAPYLAVNWEATADDIAPLVFPHPSFSEALGETFLSTAGRGLHLS
jgi:dihydrolipoamide dehydrogenase